MKLTGDEHACAEVIAGFVQRRLSAREFVPRFARLWRRDGADGTPATTRAVPIRRVESEVCALLDSINDLCETYSRSLPPGCGYRVSEEQFRKQVQAMAATNQVLDAGTH